MAEDKPCRFRRQWNSAEKSVQICESLWKKSREIEVQSSKRKKDVCTEDAENAGEDGSVKRIIEEVDADAGHAIFTEGLNVRHSANEFAFEGREGFNFLGNFQAKLKLYSFAEFASGRKIGAVPRGMFMVSTGSDSAELSMASANCRGTPLMRRAAKQRSIVTRGSLGAGTNENSTRGQYSVNGN